jgi:hypothetical protein
MLKPVSNDPALVRPGAPSLAARVRTRPAPGMAKYGAPGPGRGASQERQVHTAIAYVLDQ